MNELTTVELKIKLSLHKNKYSTHGRIYQSSG